MERALGRPLPATLAWNYPTVATLAAHLSGADQQQPRLPKLQPRPTKTAEALTAQIAAVAELSETDALLALRRRRRDALS